MGVIHYLKMLLRNRFQQQQAIVPSFEYYDLPCQFNVDSETYQRWNRTVRDSTLKLLFQTATHSKQQSLEFICRPDAVPKSAEIFPGIKSH